MIHVATTWRRCLRRGGWSCVLVSIGLAGCASAQARRYDALSSELSDAAPARRSTTPRNELLELDALRRLDRHALIEAVLARNPSVESVAQINGLLHRPPQLPLPAPPVQLDPALEGYANSEALQEEALQRRPELQAKRSRIQGREAAVDIAERRYYPDFAVMGSYNSMWMAEEHQWMLGLSLNIPIQIGARRAAVEQAEARLRQSQLQLDTATDEIRVEVERARQRVLEAQHVVRLYRERLLPAARAQIVAARIGYETERNSFQALIDAERSVRTLELHYQEALAELGQKRAELQRAIGHFPGVTDQGSTP